MEHTSHATCFRHLSNVNAQYYLSGRPVKYLDTCMCERYVYVYLSERNLIGRGRKRSLPDVQVKFACQATTTLNRFGILLFFFKKILPSLDRVECVQRVNRLVGCKCAQRVA